MCGTSAAQACSAVSNPTDRPPPPILNAIASESTEKVASEKSPVLCVTSLFRAKLPRCNIGATSAAHDWISSTRCRRMLIDSVLAVEHDADRWLKGNVNDGGKIPGLPERRGHKMEERTEFTPAELEKVQALWNAVFAVSNAILLQHQRFGLTGLSIMEKPTMDDILQSMRTFGAMMDSLMTGPYPYDEQRLMLNARQQITNMEFLALAVKNEAHEDYKRAVADLERQAAF